MACASLALHIYQTRATKLHRRGGATHFQGDPEKQRPHPTQVGRLHLLVLHGTAGGEGLSQQQVYLGVGGGGVQSCF